MDLCTSQLLWLVFKRIDSNINRVLSNSYSDCSYSTVQEDLNRICDWSMTWHLQLNLAKCMTISFIPRTAPVRYAYKLDGHELRRRERTRHLGLILDSKLTFADHVHVTAGKASRKLGLLVSSVRMSRVRAVRTSTIVQSCQRAKRACCLWWSTRVSSGPELP